MKHVLQTKEFWLRFLLTACAYGIVLALRWIESPRLDFQVWRIAEQLASQGANPYDADVLNQALVQAEDVAITEQNTDAFRSYLFNPPTWLLTVKATLANVVMLNAVGIALLAAGMSKLSLHIERSRWLITMIAGVALVGMSIGVTTFNFGQSGLFAAGLVSCYLAFGTSWAGIGALATLSFKPHMAVALGIRELLNNAAGFLRFALPITAVFVGATVLIYSPGLFVDFLGSLTETDRPVGFEDMTLRTISTRYPLPAWTGTVGLITGVGAAVFFSMKWRQADPQILALWSMALVVFLSGHGFSHDWIWIVLVPFLLNWANRTTLIAFCLTFILFLNGWDAGNNNEPRLVSTLSLVGLGVVVWLGWAAYQSQNAKSGTP